MKYKVISIFIIILTFGVNFSINSQKSNYAQTQQLNGNWEFAYILINNKTKMWELASDTVDFDYMNISLNKGTFNVTGTLIIKSGKIALDKNFVFFKTDDSIDGIIPKSLSTDYKRSIVWTRNFFEGKCYYEIENDSILKVSKTRDSILVFNRF